MVWHLRLGCGRAVERTADSSHKTIHAAFGGAVRCAQCGLDPATVIDDRAIGAGWETTAPSADPCTPETYPRRT